MKLELGGGNSPLPGFVNVDMRTGSDCVLNLEHDRLPFHDGSVEEVYSAHCLEHVANLDNVLGELCRVCRHGAVVTIRVPHWNSMDARCPSHKHVITETSVKGWGREPRYGKVLDLVTLEHVENPSVMRRAREAFPHLNDRQIAEFVPNAAFETRFTLRVRSEAR